MKKNILSISILIILLCVNSCDSESQDFEKVNIIAQGDCINGTAEGLVMEFCMFDTEGNNKTTFSENENFIFGLNLKNESKETIIIGQDLFDVEFFNVMDISESKDFGRPYSSVWCEYSLAPRELRIEPGKSFMLSCPWILDNGLSPTAPLCKSESNEVLPTGKYSTGLDTDFSIRMGERTVQLNGQSNIKLEFTIK